ncbi:GGDEF domain-containing protein [Nitratiruptor sp. SB155-2]|uniref:GGDEF domain-containing protein n=1 Tax=Nitratiruptor sp. (strain SB155-2) TaxID=387092 RepID=UPI000158700F|nr:GGDEF domain-containing protein [Nitratiruptor sp. SB155-2]BAF70237.1 signal transduction response regulator [Nitratiruptor sp. SB155-2]
MRKKFNYMLIVFVVSVFIPVAMLLVYSFRHFSIDFSKDKAYVIAKLTRDGLTTHMENGIMDKRAEFLAKIKGLRGVKGLRVLRSETVDKQFGKSFESFQKLSPLEKEVLQTGKEKDKLIEDANKVELKVVIPYIASAYNKPNCLKCHKAKEGEVLGAISMNFDITYVRDYAIGIILKIVGIILILTIIALYFLNRHLNAYITFFENLKNVMRHAYNGEYNYRLPASNEKEIQEVFRWINTLMDKIEHNLQRIATAVHSFVHYSSKKTDPLHMVTDLVEELSNIYNFKNIIDKDKDLEQIYGRIGELLNKKFGLKQFCIYEINKKDVKRFVRFEKEYEKICPKADEDISLCRAYRIKEPVYSNSIIDVCSAVEKKEYKYICIPLVLSEDVVVVVNMITKDEKEFEEIKEKVETLQNYLTISKVSLQTKLLMQELQNQSLIDRMTGAYNRRYLDIFMKKNVPQALRANVPYTIMMLDIDHFKMVNDTYGHDAGDKVIKILVDTIKENIRKSDVVVRFGGEEFLVLLYNCHKEDSLQIAENIRKSFSKKRIDVGDEKIHKTVSIGLCEFPKDTKQFWHAIKLADMALYQAKENGRNKIVACNSVEAEKMKEY